jgi:hypothetical protein
MKKGCDIVMESSTVDLLSFIFAIIAIIFAIIALYFFTVSTSNYLGIGVLSIGLSCAIASKWLYKVSKKGDIN